MLRSATASATTAAAAMLLLLPCFFDTGHIDKVDCVD